MPDNLAIINRVIQEHQVLRENVRLVGGSVNDMEAVLNLQQVYSGWTLSSTEAMNEKQKELQETVGRLEAGINRHFAWEEEALPPLFGELLMRALLAEHREIRQGIGRVRSLLADTRLVELKPERLLSEKSHIQLAINAIGQTLEEHAAREETILKMMKRALEEKTSTG